MNIANHETSTKGARVVLLEDEPALRRSLQLLLQANGFVVRAYASGSTLLTDSTPLSADCLIADYQMPERNGIEMLKILRSRGWTGSSILITGFLTPDLRNDAVAAGFGVVLEKPMRDQMLVSAVQRLIREQ